MERSEETFAAFNNLPGCENVNIQMESSNEKASADKTDQNVSFKTIQLWTDAETQQLFNKYTIYMSDVGPTKQFKHKREVWARIATDIGGKTWKQCKERFKTVVSARKTKPCTINTAAKRKDKLRKTASSKKVGRMRTVQETLLEIAARKEEARERRHKEKMERVKELQNVLEKLLQKK